MRVLIIGFGSIGRRHYEVLTNLGHEVSILTKQDVKVEKMFSDLNDAIKSGRHDYVVIANNTDKHIETFSEIRASGFMGPILIEKPLSVDLNHKDDIPSRNTYVAYNMRFNPLLQRLRDEIRGEKVISVVGYAGQYLPHWRRESDYRDSYSAFKSKGGGVLRDFSHELDYVIWLFGDWKYVSALGGKFSHLDIDTEDSFSILFETENCHSVFLHFNYLSTSPKRNLIVNTKNDSFELDFVDKTFKKNSKVESFEYDRNYSYKLQHEAILSENLSFLCSYEDARKTLNFISKIEASAGGKTSIWMNNE